MVQLTKTLNAHTVDRTVSFDPLTFSGSPFLYFNFSHSVTLFNQKCLLDSDSNILKNLSLVIPLAQILTDAATPDRRICIAESLILCFQQIKIWDLFPFFSFVTSRNLDYHPVFCNKCCSFNSLYTKKAVKCADPRDRKVKRLLRKLLLRQRAKAHRTMWLLPHDNLPVMSEVRYQPPSAYMAAKKSNDTLQIKCNNNMIYELLRFSCYFCVI